MDKTYVLKQKWRKNILAGARGALKLAALAFTVVNVMDTSGITGVDLKQVFTHNGNISTTALHSTMVCGVPIIGGEQGHNLSTYTGRLTAETEIAEDEPYALVVNPDNKYFDVPTMWSRLRRDDHGQSNWVQNQCTKQADDGRCFVLLNPRSSDVWDKPSIHDLTKRDDVRIFDLGCCNLNVTNDSTRSNHNEVRILTN